ncbi:MAG: hypothetical protein ACK2TX_02620, partial [Anaerolineales bacterium]
MSRGKGKNMLAAVYKAGHGLRLEERVRPTPEPGEALLQVAACGICGTDLRIQATGHRRLPPDVAEQHERHAAGPDRREPPRAEERVADRRETVAPAQQQRCAQRHAV